MKFRYFSCVEGCAVRRFGTDATIGARLVPGEGYVFNPDAVVAIPEAEVRRYTREYANALKVSPLTGKASLVERTEKDYEKYQASIGAAPEEQPKSEAETVVPSGDDADVPVRTRKRRSKASSGGKSQ
jgi:hypothetical protein